ncbi:MAG TPA: Hpt domain-containing protein [Thermoanaerobaculia bacterium]|jgi:chemosensory pili system protein ChpA (sensor histidine kinase/response regulator)|nr:Hpt domain-containing protein [Thermoanaerobaculia bacterium]
MAQPIDPEILAGFVAEVRGYLPRIARSLAADGGAGADPKAFEEIHRLLHSIKGASAMVGLAPLSHIASYAERTLDEIQRGGRVYDAPLKALLQATLDRIETCLDRLGRRDGGDAGGDLLAATVAEFRRWRGLPVDGDAAELATLFATEPATSGASSGWEYAAPSAWREAAPDLLSTFLEEADEHLQKISASLRALADDAADRAALLVVRRSVHTLKGAAGLVGFGELSRLAHRMEDLLDGLADGEEQPSPEDLALLHATADRLEDLTGGGRPADLVEIYRRYDERVPRSTVEVPGGDPPDRRDLSSSFAAPAAPAGPRPATPRTLRVPLERLDEVVRLAGELVIHRSVFERHVAALARRVEEMSASHERLRRLAGRLEADLEVRALVGAEVGASSAWSVGATGSPGGFGMLPPGFDALEFDRYTEFHLLSSEFAETASDLSAVSAELASSLGDFDGDLTRLSRLSSDVQNRLMRLRMVPFSQLSSRLHRAVRATAEQEGKPADLEIEGEAVELDKTVLEALADPLLHLLRNAVAHGIEPAAERRAKDKPERGRIHVQAIYEGTQVTVRVNDDGAGMDAQALVAAALAAGRLTEEESAALSYEQAIDLSFLPGLSTAGALSEVSGRGVGLDVVRAGAHRAKGTVSVRSTPGGGTTFVIRLPMSLAVARVLMVRASGESFAVPLAAVAQILRVERAAIEPREGEPVLSLDGRDYPYLHLGERLGLGPAADVSSPQVPVLILALGDRRAALAVDQVGQAREVVVKTLGPLLRRVPGISGATLTGDGDVVLIVNPGELIGEEGREPSALAAWPVSAPPASGEAEASRALKILLVDDSLSVRRVLSNLLRGVGWNPVLARDGLEALELLQGAEQPPDAILLDIEMPRMDGFELTATLRGMAEFAAVPIVILTSRAGEKHRRRAFELGATEYLVKPYEDATLVATVRRVTREALPT